MLSSPAAGYPRTRVMATEAAEEPGHPVGVIQPNARPPRVEWRCDNLMWSRRLRRQIVCNQLLMKIASGDVEIVCPKCGKIHEKCGGAGAG